MIYTIVFRAESEFSVKVEADSKSEAEDNFYNDEFDVQTLVNTGNGEPGYVENPAHDGVIQEIIE
tara:strand:- start:795 stop:989 length:195 start_codon:yes stop_codon:yes gene_type:complete